MNFEIRDAQPDDVADLVALMRELAQFESLTHLFVATEADLADALFGLNPAAGALVATLDNEVVGYALYFQNYSTFVGRRGLYLEDLYVQPALPRHRPRHRGCCARSRRSPSSASAAASNGPCSTGTARRSISTNGWAPPCCPTGAWCASRARRSMRSPGSRRPATNKPRRVRRPLAGGFPAATPQASSGSASPEAAPSSPAA